jgi:CRISPR/Cas system Type II protein with McrA/HNH and RuvC-like nuclease domain
MKHGSNKNQGSSWIRKEKRLAIYARANFCCEYCGEDLAHLPKHMVQIDHLIPRDKGGNNLHTNLLVACWKCNERKAGKTLEEWVGAEKAAEFYAKAQQPIDLELGKRLLALKKVLSA